MGKTAFIGTHGTGKSSNAHWLMWEVKDRGYTAEYIEEVARNPPKQLPINEERTLETQLWILNEQMNREYAAHAASPDFIVCDRSVIDNYAYLTTKFGRQPEIDDYIRFHLKRLPYDTLLKTIPDPEKEIEHDGVRSTDPVFQEEIVNEVDELIDFFGVKTIDFRTREEALEHVLQRTDRYTPSK